MSTIERPNEHFAEDRPEQTSHHHEHHHHHRHHRKKKKKSLKDKLPQFMKKKRFWGNLAIILAAAVLLSAVALLANRQQLIAETPSASQPAEEERPKAFNGSVTVTVPLFREEVPLTEHPVQICLQASSDVPTQVVLDDYREGTERLDIGLPVNLFYDISGLPEDCTVAAASVEISEKGSMAAPRVIELEDGKKTAAVKHLKTGTEYLYQIHVQLSDGTTAGSQGSFRTAESPRILSIDGIINVRDIGGWKTVDGRTIRQGMVYRGSELDGAIEKKFCLSAEGLEDMLTVLNVRTELDLRPHTDNKYLVDALGAGVEHVYVDLPIYKEVFTEVGMSRVQKAFSCLAQESNYPIYIHCTYGMDRTGTLCYLLEALLGMSEKDLMREYRLSSLYHGGVPQDSLEAFIEALNAYAGDTVQEKTENYLRSAGVTQLELDTIKKIMLEQ